MTPPVEINTLRNFYRLVHPGGPGWKKVVQDAAAENDPIEPSAPAKWDVPSGILAMFVGCVFVYSMLFATGNWIYSNYAMAVLLTFISAGSGYFLFRFWRKWC
jgi:hypothetical protein